MFWSLDPSSRPEIMRPIHNFFQNFNDSEHIAVSAPKKTRDCSEIGFQSIETEIRWVQMTEHVAKFSVIWLSLLADADEASPAIFPGWLDLTWAIRISIRCPLPAPTHVSQMNYIAKTSRSPHQKLGKRCLNIAKKAMRSKSWGPWQTQQVGEMVWGEERCKNVFFVATKQIMFLSRFLIAGAHIPVEYLDWAGCWNGLLDLKHGS